MIKVAYQVNNLSDARNFAAYLFDWIFLRVDHQGSFDLALFNSLAGWIAGTRIGLHIPAGSDITEILTHFKDVEGLWLEEKTAVEIPDLVIFSSNAGVNPHYLLCSPEAPVQSEAKLVLDLAEVPYEDRAVLDLSIYNGIALSGGDELRPGFKDFEATNDWLDWLEATVSEK